MGHYKIELGDVETLHKARKTKFTICAGAVYDLVGNNSLYASVSQVYTLYSNLGIDGKLLKPRDGSQFGIGYKGSCMHDRPNACVSFYRMKDNNAAAPLNSNNKLPCYAALGKGFMEGVVTEIIGAMTYRTGKSMQVTAICKAKSKPPSLCAMTASSY